MSATEGWIRKLYVERTGGAVRRGQPLLAIYSPELATAQAEYVLALRTRDAMAAGEASAGHRPSRGCGTATARPLGPPGRSPRRADGAPRGGAPHHLPLARGWHRHGEARGRRDARDAGRQPVQDCRRLDGVGGGGRVRVRRGDGAHGAACSGDTRGVAWRHVHRTGELDCPHDGRRHPHGQGPD